MSKRKDINKILVIGSGPIIIGQACEFDYSGTQACKALRSLGYKIVLVNSNPATIMTDTETADITYIEPLNVERLEKIIEKERPDALLPNLGGQSGLNLSAELYDAGVLDKYGVKILGVDIEAIKRGEDRIEFKNTMNTLGIDMAKSDVAYSVEEAVKIAEGLGYPVVVRPAYTMGGSGGGLVYNIDELKTIAEKGLQASLVNQVLIEESVIGWEELELEVVRDSKNNMITVCFIENIDPMGVHTGDSFCAAPMLTISKETQAELQRQSYKIVEAINIIGGTNVQFAHDPATGRIIVIEINPRTSRSSALASKATGFPIAFVSAMLACGLNLDEMPCGKFGTLDKYVPGGDYVVIKFARWAMEKFKGVEDKLGTQMKAVGEVMSIGKTYKEAFQKAIRSLETNRYGLGNIKAFENLSLDGLIKKLAYPSSERQFIMYEALKKGASIDKLYELTKIKKYFIEQMAEIADEEKEIASYKGKLPLNVLEKAKKDGFSDKYIASLINLPEKEIRKERLENNIVQKYEGIHVSGTKDSKYYFSTYNTDSVKEEEFDNKKTKVMILGGGPNRIGQGIEFDYCCVHASKALKELGIETIIINCNPETVSTDYDTSDRLYFEPLTMEDVLSVYEKEKPKGVIAQFGGQTPLNIAGELKASGVNILGTAPETIALAEDRALFNNIMGKLGIPMPESGMAQNAEEALKIAGEIGYPIIVRPSYVLGGRGMEIVHDDASLTDYVNKAVDITPETPILIDRFLDDAMECEADAISDGENVFVPAVMEHIELAGIHSGDSACILPSINISEKNLKTIKDYTKKIAKEMDVKGLMNIQYAIADDKVYVLEANPRASRTVPLVSKVCGINMVKTATGIITEEILGNHVEIENMKEKKFKHFGVKEAVFPFNMFSEVDPVLGPEMRSTGEVLGIAATFGEAYYKAQEAANTKLPDKGTVLISVNERDKSKIVRLARGYSECGFKILATGGTYDLINKNNIPASKIKKLHEGRPNILDAIANKEIDMIINTPIGKQGANDDSYIRKAAIKGRIPYMTTIAAAEASLKGIKDDLATPIKAVKSLQEFHLGIE
ncbi:MAG: carbamoyl-phosphate synthase large subunit [Lachnospiraceae bacterium]|nr:carbamoyl-phosphate synthase large subunit [Lachnospiraceae bacterium]